LKLKWPNWFRICGAGEAISGFCETPEVLIGLIRWVRFCDFGLLCGGNGKPNVVEQPCTDPYAGGVAGVGG
jgi:hypothetical protein